MLDRAASIVLGLPFAVNVEHDAVSKAHCRDDRIVCRPILVWHNSLTGSVFVHQTVVWLAMLGVFEDSQIFESLENGWIGRQPGRERSVEEGVRGGELRGMDLEAPV